MAGGVESGDKSNRVVCCIGDIHGYCEKLQRLWSNLQTQIGSPLFEQALIIFLGDYCDRGPDTSKVIDFLISLPYRYPQQTHVFLCGNHDLAFAAFVGVLPEPTDGRGFQATWSEYEKNEVKEGWFRGDGYEKMHVQGRRWGGLMEGFNVKKGMEFKGSIYDASPTFASYGVNHGSSDLVKAVPEEHKKFLADLVWIHEEDNICFGGTDESSLYKLIAVHAGLEKKSVADQLKLLKSRDTSLPKVEALSGRKNVWNIPEDSSCQAELIGIPLVPGPNSLARAFASGALSGRKNVWNIPEELLEERTVLVSGHHGDLVTDGRRLIIDEGGGLPDKPIAAMVLPTMAIIRDTDRLEQQ